MCVSFSGRRHHLSPSFKIQQDRERDDILKFQQDRERRRYSKSSKTEREGVVQNPARQREKEVFKIQQDRESEGEAGVVMGEAEADVKSKDITVHFSHN